MTRDLVLYKMQSCPFCVRVMDFIDENGLDIKTKDIVENLSFRDELIETGGKSQVPCLIVDGKPLYESNDIIAWLKENACD